MGRDAWRLVACELLAVLGFVVLSDAVAHGRGQEAFSLMGIVTDTDKAPLPGVRVALSNDRDKAVVITDTDGRYVFPRLRSGIYTIDASLAGFRTRTRQVDVGAARATRLDMTLRFGPMVTSDAVILTPAQQVQMASGIAHIRIAATRVLSRCADDEEFDVVQDASVLSVLEGDAPGFVELMHSNGLECTAGEPLAAGHRATPPIGAEFVVLLHRIKMDGRDNMWSAVKTFPVRNGRVETHGFNSFPPEMALEVFKAALMRLMQ